MHNLLLREISDPGTSRVKFADTDQLWFEMGTFSDNYYPVTQHGITIILQ